MSLPQLSQLIFDYDLESKDEDNTVHAILDWDFATGDFKLVDGKTILLEGIPYLKVWIEKALRTVKDTLIYKDTDYGSDHYSLIGTTFKPSFTAEEYKRYISEALLLNNAITGVRDFEFEQVAAQMAIKFTVDSIYGETSEEVKV